MIDFYKKTAGDKASRYDKQIENMNSLYNKEIDYLIRRLEKGDLTPEQEIELSKKLSEKTVEARKVVDEIIAKANEESDKEADKAQQETERSDKQKTESFGTVVTFLVSEGLALAGAGALIKNPKDFKTGALLLGSGLAGLGIPAAKKLLPLLQKEDDVIPIGVITVDA